MTNQINLHKKIIQFIQAGTEGADFAYLKSDLFINPDAIAYFYAHIDHTWIKSLAKNDFFKVLDDKSPDPTTYSYRTPELSYLRNSVDADSEAVTEVMLATKISVENFNPEVIDQFIWIASKLPAPQLSKIVEKMQQEQWVKLMAGFRKTGYEFSEMVETLQKASDWDGLINLAKALLIVRDEKSDKYRDGFFCVGDISQSGIFEALAEISEPEINQGVIVFLLEQYTKIVNIFGMRYSSEEYPFEYDGPMSLFDMDLFTVTVDTNRNHSFDADERSLIALLVNLLKNFPKEHSRIIWEVLSGLPQSRLSWKIQFIFLVYHKNDFVTELEEFLNYLFVLKDQYHLVLHGVEYKKGLQQSFDVVQNKQEYIEKVISFFSDLVSKNIDKTKYYKRDAGEILTTINDYLLNDQMVACKTKFEVDPEQELELKPSVTYGEVGVVHHQSPFTLSDYSIDEIFEHLKTDWDPARLKQEYRNDDHLKPRGAEGLGDALKEQVKQNLDAYLSKMSDLNYEGMHPHYAHSLLRGLEELFREGSKLWKKSEIESVLNVLINLQNQKSVMQEFKPVEDSWLGNWVWVKRSMADVLIYIIEYKDKNLRKEIHNDHRTEILGLLNFLFETSESPNAEEEKPEYGDPFHIAINSVRGRVYQGFVVYVENDGDVLSKESKEFFEKALKDTSIAVRFVIGHYLPSLYYRAKEYISDKFSEIFPEDQSDKLATWEGYLCSPLYKELYEKLEKYYERALDITSYHDRKYTKDLDEALASHVALAFVHFQKDHTSGLVEKFLEKRNSKQIGEFVTFIGRSYFTRDVANKADLEKFPGRFKKFIDFWDWIIKQKLEPQTYGGFGFWVNKQIIDTKTLIDKIDQTFEISKGAIRWEYKFEQSLKSFAKEDPDKTLNIIENYLLTKKPEGEIYLNPNRRYPLFAIEDEIKKSLEIIYQKPELKEKIKDFINLLLEKGGQMFWRLEDIIK